MADPTEPKVIITIKTDKDAYSFGDSVRVDVNLEIEGEPPSPNYSPVIEGKILQRHDDVYHEAYTYPPYPMRYTKDRKGYESWFCHPVHEGRWGEFRASVLVRNIDDNYDPALGEAETDFTVIGPQ